MSPRARVAPTAPAPTASLPAGLLSRRLIVVGGKGGTGKTSLAAALCMLAGRRGKRVLGIDVDAKGDLARALGSEPVGFQPKVVLPNISVLAMHAEESLQEYLNVYFKVPKFARMTPLSRVFDFIASGVPGPKDMLVIGKIAYEERRRDRDDHPTWDLVVVDGTASGHLVGQLSAARSMHTMMQGGIIRHQTEWIEATITDIARTVLCICALPEEMPIVEALELEERTRNEAGIHTGAFFLNRAFPIALDAHVTALARALDGEGHRDAVRQRLGGDPHALLLAAQMARRLHERTQECSLALRRGTGVPVVEVPLLEEGRGGQALARAVAASLDRSEVRI